MRDHSRRLRDLLVSRAIVRPIRLYSSPLRDLFIIPEANTGSFSGTTRPYNSGYTLVLLFKRRHYRKPSLYVTPCCFTMGRQDTRYCATSLEFRGSSPLCRHVRRTLWLQVPRVELQNLSLLHREELYRLSSRRQLTSDVLRTHLLLVPGSSRASHSDRCPTAVCLLPRDGPRSGLHLSEWSIHHDSTLHQSHRQSA